MQVPVQVLNSRPYSFQGRDNKPVSIVEVLCLLKFGAETIVGKVNTRGNSALPPGNYSATLRATEKEGKLAFSLGDFVPAANAYAAASAGK